MDVQNRSDLTMRIARLLAEKFEKFDAQSIADLFVASFQKIGINSPTCPSVEDVRFAIERYQKQRKEKRNEQQSEQSERIREAFGTDRTNPYTPSELQSFGVMSKRWIIQYDRSFYLFFNGAYKGPYTEASVLNVAACWLSPAASAGVELYTISKDGERSFKQLKMLVDQYGSVAESVVIDLTAQKTTYDEASRVITEAPCPLRHIEPVYHEAIDRWLRILAGKQYEDLKTWLAAVTHLALTCVALFLTGPKGVGKSLLMHGLARLWTELGPTTLDEVFAQFNSKLLDCPLTVADEALPKDWRGRSKNSELRLHIQALVRELKRKFLPTCSVRGATRTIVGANNDTVLRTSEGLTPDDVDAIAARYFWIAAPEEAAEYLRSVDTTLWVSGDRIAQHVTWLIQNHRWQPRGRFIIAAADPELRSKITSQSGRAGECAQWLVSFLLNQGEYLHTANGDYVLVVKKQGESLGRLLVNVKGLYEGWSVYLKDSARPEVSEISRALKTLCLDRRTKLTLLRDLRNKDLPSQQKRQVNFYAVDLPGLRSWAENTGFATTEDIDRGLAVDSGTLLRAYE